MNIKRLFLALALGLGLALGLLCLLGSQNSVALADPGILYVAPGGNCGGATPCYATVQAAVDAASEGDVIKVAQGTYTGVQNVPSLSSVWFTATQVVVITKTVVVRGGYATSDWDAPHPAAHPTTLDAQGQGRVLYIKGNISPTIEGLRITGGDATGLVGGGYSYYRNAYIDGGGGVYVREARATIRNCAIFSNTASTTRSGSGGGVYLASSEATLRGSTLQANTASTAYDGSGSGGGVYLSYSKATLSDNTVIGNTGSMASWGSGGGVELFESEATLSGNTVISNTASASGNGYGGGLYLWISDATLNGNRIIGNRASTGGGEGYGGGLMLTFSDAMLTNDVIADNQASALGSGLYVDGSIARLVHTTIARNGSAGRVVAEAAGLTGGSGGDGTGLVVVGSVDWDGGYNTGIVVMTNTVLVGHTVGITVAERDMATLNATLWHDNTTNWAGTGMINRNNDRYGDPAFAADGYHLTAASAAIDRGVDARVKGDMDGDYRPQGAGYDIGADEYLATPPMRPAIYLSLVPANYPACGPSDEQIALYVDANYGGQCVVKDIGDYPTYRDIGLPYDSISSIKVGQNVQATLCRDGHFGGRCEVFTADDPNLSDNQIGDNTVSSVRVQPRTMPISVR